MDLIGLKAWQDPANTDSQFLRVKVRHELMPKIVEVLGESAISSLDKTSQLLRVDNQALEDLAQKFFESQKDVKTNGLEISELEKLPEAIRTRVLRIFAIASGVHPGPFSFEHIEAIDALVKNWLSVFAGSCQAFSPIKSKNHERISFLNAKMVLSIFLKLEPCLKVI